MSISRQPSWFFKQSCEDVGVYQASTRGANIQQNFRKVFKLAMGDGEVSYDKFQTFCRRCRNFGLNKEQLKKVFDTVKKENDSVTN